MSWLVKRDFSQYFNFSENGAMKGKRVKQLSFLDMQDVDAFTQETFHQYILFKEVVSLIVFISCLRKGRWPHLDEIRLSDNKISVLQ